MEFTREYLLSKRKIPLSRIILLDFITIYLVIYYFQLPAAARTEKQSGKEKRILSGSQ